MVCNELRVPTVSPRTFLSLWWRRRARSRPDDEEQDRLEGWVRLRLHVLSDPMIAIIGAVGRLTEAGVGVDDAVETVLRILHEEADDSPIPK